ncbi:MAG: hypothetical protein V7K72_03595 [Nostoc sp.]|uniref:hypothetical protein n=1 Tax=Nostoc sp. TaxID=1180 RepID=UPI002FFA4ECE
MTQSEAPQKKGWQPYNLDYDAQQLVLKNRNNKDVLNESHKMRMAVAYGLERFWGEHLRLGREKPAKGKYWKAVWDKLAEILKKADIPLPNDDINSQQNDRRRREEEETQKIQQMAQKIWSMPIEHQRVALMVLTQLCDALVWWTQRYKIKGADD